MAGTISTTEFIALAGVSRETFYRAKKHLPDLPWPSVTNPQRRRQVYDRQAVLEFLKNYPFNDARLEQINTIRKNLTQHPKLDGQLAQQFITGQLDMESKKRLRDRRIQHARTHTPVRKIQHIEGVL